MCGGRVWCEGGVREGLVCWCEGGSGVLVWGRVWCEGVKVVCWCEGGVREGLV